MNDWISAEDRLPEDGGYVLIAGDMIQHGTVAWWDVEAEFYDERINADREGWWRPLCSDMLAIRPDRVTHWMPLPEPPEEI